MIDESQLMRRIAELPDGDLLRIIYADSSKYRFEAVVYAKAEMEKRGLVVDEASIERAASMSLAESTPTLPLKLLAWLTSRVATFAIGFIGGLCLFILVNYQSVEHGPGSHGFVEAGWPYKFYRHVGYDTYIYWPHLLANVLISLAIGVGIGYLFSRIISFIKSSIAE